METPEFAFERDASNVANAIHQFGLHYPVVQDNNMGTWDAYANESWPADFLIDAQGQVRYATVGEGDYSQTETAIRALLAEAGDSVGGKSPPTGVIVPSAVTTPETYLGTAPGRREGRSLPRISGGATTGPSPPGAWRSTTSPSAARGDIAARRPRNVAEAGIDLEFDAKNVYLVLSSPGERPLPVTVLLDGRPIPLRDAGADVHGGVVTVRGQRLYALVSLPQARQQHRLSLRFAPGVTGNDVHVRVEAK